MLTSPRWSEKNHVIFGDDEVQRPEVGDGSRLSPRAWSKSNSPMTFVRKASRADAALTTMGLPRGDFTCRHATRNSS